MTACHMKISDCLLQEARTKARQFLNESPAGGYATIIENWRQLSDGQIEFTIRRLPTRGLMDSLGLGLKSK